MLSTTPLFSLGAADDSRTCARSLSESSLLDDWSCAAGAPLQCSDGVCLSSGSQCDPRSCPDTSYVPCTDANGAPAGCASKPASCAADACSTDQASCADGGCAVSASACAAVPACPTARPLRCDDGSCVPVGTECPASFACAAGRQRCADGRCAEACPPTDGCGPALPLACADGLCYAATATCAAVTTATPPRLAKHAALNVFVGGVAAAATTVPLHSASSEVARLTVPAGAFASDALLLFAPVTDSVLAEAQVPATWASWQSSIFSAVVGVDAAAGGATALASGRSLSVTLAATVPSTIAISDTCLGYLQQLDATRRVWRCAGAVSASATGADNEYLVSGSLSVVAPFALIFSDTAEAAHPDYALPPPAGPPPPAVPEGTLALVVALFALFLLAVAAVVAACGLAAMGPIVVQRSTRVEPDAKGGGGGGGGYGGGGYGGGGGGKKIISE